jgi:hypothetical protein
LDPRIVAFWNRIEEIQRTDTAANMEGEVLPPVMPLAPEAETVWLGLYNDTEAEQGRGGDYSTLKPFAGRAGELARRLATSLAFFAGDRVIGATVMEGACKLVRHSLGEWLRFLHEANPPAELVKAQELLDWLQRNQLTTFHKDDLGKRGPTRNKAKLRDQLLGLLVEHGWVSTPDGKQFTLRKSADCAESAEGPVNTGGSSAETVRKSAEDLRKTSEKSEETEIFRTSPQTFRSEDARGTKASAESAESALFPEADSLSEPVDPDSDTWEMVI